MDRDPSPYQNALPAGQNFDPSHTHVLHLRHMRRKVNIPIYLFMVVPPRWNLHRSMHAYVCMCVCVYVCMCVCVYVCIYVFPYDTVINWPTTSADFHKSVVGVHGLNLPAQVVSFHLHQPLCTSRVALFICSELGEGSKYWNSSMVVLQVLCGSDWFH